MHDNTIMANEAKKQIWLHLADVNPIPLSVNPSEEEQCRRAEELVNSLWDRWMRQFAEKGSSSEVLARVAFRFAQLYYNEYAANKGMNDFLKKFEKELDSIVVDV